MSEALTQSSKTDPYAIPLEEFDMIRQDIFHHDNHVGFFERLRKEDPVHLQDHEVEGKFWNVTRYKDIMHVDTTPDIYSSEGSITVSDQDEDFTLPMFIAMDRPKHDDQRKEVSGVVAPTNLAKLESTIRERVQNILDSLPLDEEFDWVDRVSIELTTQMLATLFDFPFEDRRKLTYWSDMATSGEFLGGTVPETTRRAALMECLETFTQMRNERAQQPLGTDLVSMLAHGPDTRDMEPMEYLGNLILLIVGGNDTTRNSISGGVLALNKHPEEYQKLRANPALIKSMVPEIIRWQTPLAYMRRTALADIEFRGKTICAGDKVLMWYISGNRDAEVIDDPEAFIIDRPQARHHLSFGFGVHRCMGNRLAEMQLRVLWEEIMTRFDKVEVVGPAERVQSSFVHGIAELPVILHAKA